MAPMAHAGMGCTCMLPGAPFSFEVERRRSRPVRNTRMEFWAQPINWILRSPPVRRAEGTPESDERSGVLVLKVIRSKLGMRIEYLEKRFSNGWRKRQVTLVVSHKARPSCVDQS